VSPSSSLLRTLSFSVLDLRDRLQSALGPAYRLHKELGGGGMSRVFLAEEVRLGRQVVVKVLPPEMAAGVNAERFEREIRLAAKPDNVLFSGKHALVADFGVAKAVAESTGKTALTSLGVALGTPAYMAPEQAATDPNTDHRADIYAVGALAYEMLAGRPPFIGPSPQAVLAAHVTSQPDPVTKYRDSVPPALAALVMRCLAKHPADRFQSAGDVLEALEQMVTPSGGITPT